MISSAPMSDDRAQESVVEVGAGSFGALARPRKWLLGLSLVSLVICAVGGFSHYSKLAWGNPGQVGGWLLSMLFLLLALSPTPQEFVKGFKGAFNWKTAFFAFWVLFFAVSHLWRFRTAPWNGNGLFDESGWDLFFLKQYVIGHPYQAAWFHSPLSRETLFHYYVWAFLGLFGYNILSYEAALFFISLATFLFTLLLVDLFFDSKIVTTITALVFNFLPFAYVYTYAGYRYPMGTALCVISLYFLHYGFKKGSPFSLGLGGIMAGLCVASSITGKQYIFVLLVFGVVYTAFHWRKAKARCKWEVPLIAYGCIAAGMPLLCYIAFTFEHYTLYESALVRDSLNTGLKFRARQLWDCFFQVPGARFFIPDTRPIPLPYFAFLLPGLGLALWRKRFEIVFLATLPVVGAFLATAWENRLLLAVPFWMILMAFTFAALLRVKLMPAFKNLVWCLGLSLIAAGLVPSIMFIDNHTKNPGTVWRFAQGEVAVSRFLRKVVAGVNPINPPRLERDEFNRVPGIPAPSFDTLICQESAYSLLHMFLHDYDDAKIMSFCSDLNFHLQSEQQIWTANKKVITGYHPVGKDLKLVWERNPKTDRIINLFEGSRDIGRVESLTMFFEGKGTIFHVFNVQSVNIGKLQERVWAMPDVLP